MTWLPLDIAIDVSDNNPAIDWPAAFAAGIRIAFVKIMESAEHAYPSGPVQLAGARAAGILAVPYAYLRPTGNPACYAGEFARRAELARDAAFALDWEGRASQTCTPSAAQEIGERLAEIACRYPIGYWGIPGATPAAPTARMEHWARWVPRYPKPGARQWSELPQRAQQQPELFWEAPGMTLPQFAQYTAWGRVPGIAGEVDRSVAFFPTLDDAIAWTAGKAPQKPVDAIGPVSATGVAGTPVSRAGTPAHEVSGGKQSADDLNRAELDSLAGETPA